MKEIAFLLSVGIVLGLGASCHRKADDWAGVDQSGVDKSEPRDKSGRGAPPEDWNGRLYASNTSFGPADWTYAIRNGVEVAAPPVEARRISVPAALSRTERLHPILDKWLWQQCKQDFQPVLQELGPYKVPDVNRFSWFDPIPLEAAVTQARQVREDLSLVESSSSAQVWFTSGIVEAQNKTLLSYTCICLPGEYARDSGKPCVAGMKPI